MQFVLSDFLLKLKEDSLDVDVHSEWDKNLIKENLDYIIEQLEDSVHSIQTPEIFYLLCQYIKRYEELDDYAVSKLVDLLISTLQTTVEKEENFKIQDFERFRYSLEQLVFLLYWLMKNLENQCVAKAIQQKSQATTTKKTKPKTGKEDFDWQRQKERALAVLFLLLKRDLNKIWTMMNERLPFINMFVEISNQLLENEQNLKHQTTKHLLYEIQAITTIKYSQESGFLTTILQNLRYSNHLSEPMAEIVLIIVDQYSSSLVFENILREIGQIEFSGDDKTAKEFSKFLIKCASLMPKEFLKHLSLIGHLMDSDSYTIRCSLIEAFGFLMGKHLLNDYSETNLQLSISLCHLLEERLMDVSSFCRARVLKVFYYLCDIHDEQEEEEEQQLAPKRHNAIPLARRLMVFESASGRLYDKSSLVRKEAIRLLTKFIETHPFWLDGGVLDLNLFERNLKEIDIKIQENLPSDDFIEELKRALPQEAQEKLEKDTGEVVKKSLITDEEMEDLKKKKRYYQDAILFCKQVNDVIPILLQLLVSKTKTDVIESIQFFVEAYRHSIDKAKQGVKKMIHLVWSKDVGDQELKSIREHLLQAFQQLFLDVEAPSDKERAKIIVRNLITLTFHSTLADLTSLEQLLSLLMLKERIDQEVIHHLWNVYGSSQPIPSEQRRGAMIVLGMLAKESKQLVLDRIQLMIKIGFGQFGKQDLLLAKHTCAALRNLVQKKTKKPDEEAFQHFDREHLLFKKMKALLLQSEQKEYHWFGLAEQVLDCFYNLAEQPDLLSQSLIRHLTKKSFIQEQPVGHVATKQIAYLESVERELKRRNPSDMKPEKEKKLDDPEIEQVVGSCEDEIGETFAYVREKELLFHPKSLLNRFSGLVLKICQNPQQFPDELLQRMSILTLCKFMCVSEQFCEQNLLLLFQLMERTRDPSARSNMIIAMGDLTVCFNNLIDQNISYLYKRLLDSDVSVKKNALMVLTHLILNGMVKVKGQISQMAVCLEDKDVRIKDLAQLFFTELAMKDNAVYNLLPDMISSLSQGPDDLQFKSIMKFLFSFIEKERQSENIVEKLCLRFKNISDVGQCRHVAFCLSLLPFGTEKSYKKLFDYFSFYHDKLTDEQTFKYFQEILGKAKKLLQKPEFKQLYTDYEMKLNEAYYGPAAGGSPRQPLKESDEVMMSPVRRLTTEMKRLKISKSKKSSISTKRRRQTDCEDSDSVYDLPTDENLNANATRLRRSTRRSRV